MFKNLTIKTKITLIGGISTILVAFVIIFYASNSMQKEAIFQAKNNVLNVTKNNATNIKIILENTYKVVETIENIFHTHISNSEKISRKQVIDILKQVLSTNPNFLGVGTFWEPNAFDANDKNFANVEGNLKTGRFTPYVYRNPENNIKLIYVHNDVNNNWDWYEIPKNTKQISITEPFYYYLSGKNILMITISFPIILKDKFYGVVAADIALDEFQQITDDLNIYEKTGIGGLISDDGTIIALTNKTEFKGKQWKDYLQSISIPTYLDLHLKLIKNKNIFIKYSKKKKYFISFAPISIKNIKNNWSFMIKVPEEKVLEESRNVLKNVIFIGVGLTIVVLFLFWLALEKIINPLLKLIKTKTKKLEDSLTELKQTQKHMVQTEKMASLGGLVAGVAHEINTPIGLGITSTTHFLAQTQKLKKLYEDEQMSQEDFEEYIKNSSQLAQITYENLKRSAELVKSFKQISVDQTNEQKRQFNLKRYIEDTLLSLHNRIKHTKIQVELKCDENIHIYSYAGAFSQIVTNLIINSLIHGYDDNESGTINLNFRVKNSILYFRYMDDGKGISEKYLKKIFDPFFTTNRKHGGSGLGLNIIYNIITQQLDGTIECNSEETKGVEFIIVIPIQEERVYHER